MTASTTVLLCSNDDSAIHLAKSVAGTAICGLGVFPTEEGARQAKRALALGCHDVVWIPWNEPLDFLGRAKLLHAALLKIGGDGPREGLIIASDNRCPCSPAATSAALAQQSMRPHLADVSSLRMEGSHAIVTRTGDSQTSYRCAPGAVLAGHFRGKTVPSSRPTPENSVRKFEVKDIDPDGSIRALLAQRSPWAAHWCFSASDRAAEVYCDTDALVDDLARALAWSRK